MAKDYSILIVTHFNKLKEAIDKRGVVTKNDLMKAISDEWEFEKAFSSTVAYIGELSAKLDDTFKHEHSKIDWAALKAIRNIIDHDYEAVNFRRLINIYFNHIVPLAEVLCRN